MKNFQRWGMIIAFIVIIASAYVGIKTIFMEDKSAIVPALVGTQLIDAVEALQKQGLLAKVDQVDSQAAAETVISQNLLAGERVAPKTVVLLRVSKGGSVLPIPDVRGMKFEEAVNRLKEAGFKVDTAVTRVSDKFKPAGAVIAQNPSAPVQVSANTLVKLLVSTGSDNGSSFVRVPDLKGQSLKGLEAVLEQYGLIMGLKTERATDSVPPGTILSTKPKSSASVPQGTKINVTVARKAHPSEIQDEQYENTADRQTGTVRPIVVVSPEPSEIPTKHYSLKEIAEGGEQGQHATLDTEIDYGPKKTAKVRYQVPPLSKPLSLRIEMTDATGTKILQNKQATSGEYISMNVPYYTEATITIYLGGDFVWEDRYN